MSQQTVPTNRLRATATSRLAVGTMLVEFRQPSIMTILANAGFDFVIIDNEHGPFPLDAIADLARAARHEGITPIVRPPELSYAHITQPLDAGAQGIMLPRVRSADDVRDCLAMMKYPPEGRRGAVLGRGHTGFRSPPLLETLAEANRQSLLMAQIETAEALAGLESILSVPGLDAVLVGPTDLSVALGVGGQLRHPDLVRSIETVIEGCKRHGVIAAIQQNDLADAVRWAKAGMQMVSVGSEVGHLTSACAGAIASVRAANESN